MNSDKVTLYTVLKNRIEVGEYVLNIFYLPISLARLAALVLVSTEEFSVPI